MNKKNLFWSILAILMVTIQSVAITACGSDDEEDNADETNAIVGTWSGQDGKENLTMIFKSDGTGAYISRYNSSSGMDTESGTFTYIMEGDKKGLINVRFHDSYSYSGKEYETLFFVIEGEKMSLFDDYYYDDLEWILTRQ